MWIWKNCINNLTDNILKLQNSEEEMNIFTVQTFGKFKTVIINKQSR